MVFSEKSFKLLDMGVISLIFAKHVNKIMIREMCKNIFGISPVSVNTCNVKPKTKHYKGVKGVRKGFKKAFIKVAPEDINKIKEVAE
ncbi:MAG: 50S ribosomal protein L23 [Alphaproteobacteria bacterium]|nr:MAG: 50S ribosomal protein L23 [Alphaproteobacteria bacterium]